MADFDFKIIRPVGQALRTVNTSSAVCVYDHLILHDTPIYLKEHAAARLKKYQTEKTWDHETKKQTQS